MRPVRRKRCSVSFRNVAYSNGGRIGISTAPLCTDIFEKHIGKGWTLQKIAHAEIGAPVGKGCYWDEHELVGPAENQTIHCPAWEWADLDGKRLVWAANGKLCAAKVQKDGLAEEVELHDFNDMAFEAIEASY